MRYTTLVVAALASAAIAHSDPRDVHAGIPKMLGGRKFLAELRKKNILPDALKVEKRSPAPAPAVEKRVELDGDLEERQIDPSGQCGPGFGYCPAGQCCSIEGWCGVGIDYCASPDCQFLYGPACDANTIPAGNSTAGIARPYIGTVPYGGAGIYDCVVDGDVAFTFDDGPYNYTSDLLDKLAVYNASATFMITGNNLGKGPIDSTPEWTAIIQRMISEGHQIASHTWSHQNLTSLDPTYFNRQIIYNEMAFRNILGFFPTYMRPPYSECNDTCGTILGNMGYHVTYFDLDTEGYLNDSPTLIQNSKNIWDAAMAADNSATTSILEIEHDIHYQTVYNLTDYILASMYAHGYKSVTVGQCLGDPAVNWYRSGNPNAPVPPSTQSISDDGTCSASITCYGSTFGNCCSSAGWCGSTSAYCGAGCQPASGNCTSTSSSTSSVKTSSTTVKSSTSSVKTTSTTSSIKATSTSTTSSKSTSNTVKSSSTTSSKASSTSTASQAISTDGTCGTTITCVGSTFGNCCSQYGYCGSTAAYCGTGCNPVGGTCSSSSSSSSSSVKASSSSSTSTKSTSSSTKSTSSSTSTKPTTTSTSTTKSSSTSTKSSATATSSLKVSADGTCGGTENYTCQGSTYGNCCSQYSWCGSTSAYCLTSGGCQSAFGTCQ